MPAARSEVQLGGVVFIEIFQPEHVRLSKIIDVNIVADSSSIRSKIVIAENFESGALTADGVECSGNQVRFRIMHFANFDAFVCPGGIEIPEGDILQAVSARVRLKRIFEGQLGSATRVSRVHADFLL